MLGVLIASRKVSYENYIVACSRQLMMIRSGDLFLRCLRVMFLMTGGHGTQCQNLISGNYAPQPVRHTSPRTMQS